MPPPRRQWLASGGACMPAEAPGCVAAVCGSLSSQVKTSVRC